jgi:hypothetical protein
MGVPVRVPRSILAPLLAAGMVVAAGAAAASPAVASPARASASPIRLIVDTDFGQWWDDVAALATVLAAADTGRVRLLAVMSDVDNPWDAAGLDAVNTWYGRPDIPIRVATGAISVEQNYSQMLAQRYTHAGQPSDAVGLYRRLLRAQPDHSVTILSIGALTNLAQLARTDAALVARKVHAALLTAWPASRLHLDQPATSESQHAPPLSLAAQFHTGLAANPPNADTREPVLLLTVEVAIWLTALSADRRPDERGHTEEPLPAALSLHEAYDLLAALTRCASTAHSALAQLTQSSDMSGEILVDLTVETRPGIGSVIDLSNIRRVGTGRQSQYRQAFTARTIPIESDSPMYTPALGDITVSALSEWLLQAGYRDYEQQLRDLWQPPAPSSTARPDVPERESQVD